MLSAGNRVSGAIIRGILPEQEGTVSDVIAHIKTGSVGSLKDGNYGIILGSDLVPMVKAAANDIAGSSSVQTQGD